MSESVMANAPADEDSPVMVAWQRYKESAEFSNSRKWASDPEHVVGSLWAAFAVGFESGREDECHLLSQCQLLEGAAGLVIERHDAGTLSPCVGDSVAIEALRSCIEPKRKAVCETA